MRNLGPAGMALLAAGQAVPVLLIEMQFAPPLYLATSPVHIEWGGHIWLGAGPLGSVDPLQDSVGDAQGVKFSLSGVPQEMIAIALGQSARNKRCLVRLALLDPTTHAVVVVEQLGTYILDQLPISGTTIGTTGYSLSRVFARPKPVRYTDGDQQRLHPGDKCLEYIVSQSTHQDTWPAASWGRQ